MKTLLLTIFGLSIVLGFSQTQNFTVHLGDDSIGFLTAKRLKKGDSETIRITSDTKFSILLLKQKMRTNSVSIFKRDSLKVNKSESALNDNADVVTTSHKGNEYLLSKDGKSSSLRDKISFTVSKLYFYEPKNVSSIYSERHLSFCTITPVKENMYRLVLPNGNVNYYTYKAGKLVSMTSKRYGMILKFVGV